jgi:hypothetical protein
LRDSQLFFPNWLRLAGDVSEHDIEVSTSRPASSIEAIDFRYPVPFAKARMQ